MGRAAYTPASPIGAADMTPTDWCSNVARLIESLRQGDSAAEYEIKRMAYIADEGQRLVHKLTEALQVMHETNVEMRDQISRLKTLVKKQ